ncbi:HEC/Ndc80p domain protein [Leptospira borgpetersenii serovar Pomona str. 200901868]|uniref:HEC/Ndc80p domain protein n=1 Tax=Leptospira borgpetersenii serovar Pomona str. 200901868 TaxID=1192866 RepID=M6W5D1_LEPBO|nr:HEC/Ndc80p domain protein [Leptospira borgpetersenii serovar Pomona str. 200901868]
MEVFFRAFKLKNIKRFFHSKKNERIESSFISSNLFENPTSFDFFVLFNFLFQFLS